MSTFEQRRTEPLVALISDVPILREALSAALAGMAEVRHFPAGRGELNGLLRAIEPDAVIVDCPSDADAAAVFARATGVPLVRLSLDDQDLRVFDGSGWIVRAGASASAEAIANEVLGGLYGRGRAR